MDKRNLDCFTLQFSNREKLKEAHSLNHLLDQLNALDFRTISFPDNSKKMTYIVTECLSAVDPKETFLVAKCCQLLQMHAARADVALEPSLLLLAVPWCLQALQRCGDLALLDILQALDTVLRTSGDNLPHQLVGDVIQALSHELECVASLTAPADVRVWRVQCLTAAARAVTAAHRPLYVDTLRSLLTRRPQLNSEADAQVVKCVLEALEAVCVAEPAWLAEAGVLGDVLGVVMAYLHYGLEDWQPQAPVRLLPLPGAQWDPPSAPATPTNKVGGKAKRRQKKKRVSTVDVEDDVKVDPVGPAPPPPIAPWLTSDSDMSDSEGGRLRRVRAAQARVRVAAFNLLAQVTKSVDVREMFGYYSSVAGAGGLCHSLLAETSAQLSGAAATTLAYMLAVAKPYFAHAQHSTVTSFTPFSSVLSSLLDTLHGVLARVLTTVPALQCAACLVDVSPYHRLRPGLLAPLLRAVTPLVNHKEVVLSVAALTLVGAVVCVEPCPDDVLALLATPSPAARSHTPWVLADALAYFQREKVRVVSAPVRVEWWQVVSSAVRLHWPTLARPHARPLLEAVLTDVAARLDLVRLHAVRTLQQLATALASHSDDAADCAWLWERVLCSGVTGLVGASPALAGATCDCLATISPVVFQDLPDKQQIWCVTTLLGCARDEEAPVRAAALQALAVYITFPTLSQDEQFVEDVSEVVCVLLHDPVPLVSAKAAWALGNITDMLYNAQHGDDVVPPIKLISASIEAAQGKLKVRANGVRALGNLLGLLSAGHLSRPEYRDVPQRAATVLLNNATSTANMKVSWNACYALGSMLRNSALHEASPSWQGEVWSALCSLVARSPNYKVCTTACGALAGAAGRSHYGTHYLAVWRAVLLGLDNTHDTPDFREIRHQDGLLQQLCLTLCHLAGLVEVSDLSSLHEEIVYRLDTLQQHLSRFVSSAVPERADAVLRTAARLATLRDQSGDGLGHTQRATLTMLTDIFTFDL